MRKCRSTYVFSFFTLIVLLQTFSAPNRGSQYTCETSITTRSENNNFSIKFMVILSWDDNLWMLNEWYFSQDEFRSKLCQNIMNISGLDRPQGFGMNWWFWWSIKRSKALMISCWDIVKSTQRSGLDRKEDLSVILGTWYFVLMVSVFLISHDKHHFLWYHKQAKARNIFGRGMVEPSVLVL